MPGRGGCLVSGRSTCECLRRSWGRSGAQHPAKEGPRRILDEPGDRDGHRERQDGHQRGERNSIRKDALRAHFEGGKKSRGLEHVERIGDLAEEKNGPGMEKRGHIAAIMSAAQQQRGEKSDYRYFSAGDRGERDDHGKACEAGGVGAPAAGQPAADKTMVKEHAGHKLRQGVREHQGTHRDIAAAKLNDEGGRVREKQY
jgi:hypothetical protein